MVKIEIVHGDITKIQVDAIVNAANSRLAGGGGVDGAIHRAAGPQLAQECQQIIQKQGLCPPGQAVITSAGLLPCRFVIHTVGPIWQGGRAHESETLASCYQRSLELAEEYQCKSIAFPSISTGAYGFPIVQACPIALKTVSSFPYHLLEKVIFVLFSPQDYSLYLEEAKKLHLI